MTEKARFFAPEEGAGRRRSDCSYSSSVVESKDIKAVAFH